MHDVQQTIIGRGFCDTPSRTEHSLRLLLEIRHCARNLQISNLCKHLKTTLYVALISKINCKLLANEEKGSEYNV